MKDSIPHAKVEPHRPSPRTKLSRSEKSEVTRRRLFEAAIEIVGEYGYADSSVARITERAGVALGTFYNYFESRQDLLDQLLPAISHELLDFIRKKTVLAGNPVDREQARMAGFFEFLEQAPNRFKILSEGPVQAPEGFRRHLDFQTRSYRRALRYEFDHGNLRIADLDELEVITQILLSSREYLSARFCFVDGTFRKPPDFVIEAYMAMVRRTLFRP
jgi:AcrR family transcriptional regulator